jgi:hypothetical protein
MLGVPSSELAAVAVVGSRSGPHAGRLAAYSQGDGASFLPSSRFREGELVTVHAKLREGAQSIPFAWRFTVATRVTANIPGSGTQPPVSKAHDYQRFLSRPDLRPPTVTVSARSTAIAPGDLFLAPYSGPGQYGPMILDANGALVWFKALSAHTRAADFRVQEYQGQPVLTWWQDPLVADGRRSAGVVIANSAYQNIAIVRAGNGYQPDLHEFEITPQDTALMTVYSAIQCNLSSVHGPRDGAVADSLMQEIDLRTGLVMFEWHSLDHVSLADSYVSSASTGSRAPFDYFHINSIDVERDGDFLIDSRNTWTAYEVYPRTGQVQWRLGGKHSSFAMAAGAKIAWQHDARQQPDGTITFFDNGASPRMHPQSRAIAVTLDMQHKTAGLARRYEHPSPLVAGSQGNFQTLPNGDSLVGWGQVPDFSEFNAAGQLLFDAHLPAAYECYRTFRFPWSGSPGRPPALVARPGARGETVLYASWNGATQVAAWRVLRGAVPTNLHPVAQAAHTGFESAIPLPTATAGPYVAVQALDAGDRVLGTSTPIRAFT